MGDLLLFAALNPFVTLIRFRDDEAHEEPAVTLDAFLSQSNANAVRIAPGEDARLLLPYLDRLQRIEIAFPKFRDGRGYSSARILRESGFTGEMRATGDVLLDQVVILRRCGFDALASDHVLDPAKVEEALARFPAVYQKAADAKPPVWVLRHA